MKEDIVFCCNCGEKMYPNMGSQCACCNGQLCQECTDESIDICSDCETEQEKFNKSEGKGI